MRGLTKLLAAGLLASGCGAVATEMAPSEDRLGWARSIRKACVAQAADACYGGDRSRTGYCLASEVAVCEEEFASARRIVGSLVSPASDVLDERDRLATR